MEIANIPAKFPIPWADTAAPPYIRAVPETSQIGIQAGAASLADGFPPATFTPESAGGTPPWGADTNGILNQITLWNQWQAAGAPVSYDSGFATSIGGYPQGAVLASSVTVGLFWRSTVDNNITDPDAVSAANWVEVGRVKLSADTTFYVATTGSDTTGTGLTVGSPWLTAQHASNILAQRYDLNGFVATILRASGSYTDSVLVQGPYVGAKDASSVVFLGSGAASTTVTTAGVCYTAQSGARFTVSGQRLVSTGANLLNIDYAAAISYGSIDFGPVGSGVAQILVDYNGLVSCIGPCTLSASASSHVTLSLSAIWVANAQVYTLTGTPAYSSAFVNCQNNSTVNSQGMTFSGSATGSRYSASLNGVIQTSGSGANYFPGNSAGSTATGGQYA